MCIFKNLEEIQEKISGKPDKSNPEKYNKKVNNKTKGKSAKYIAITNILFLYVKTNMSISINCRALPILKRFTELCAYK